MGRLLVVWDLSGWNMSISPAILDKLDFLRKSWHRWTMVGETSETLQIYSKGFDQAKWEKLWLTINPGLRNPVFHEETEEFAQKKAEKLWFEPPKAMKISGISPPAWPSKNPAGVRSSPCSPCEDAEAVIGCPLVSGSQCKWGWVYGGLWRFMAVFFTLGTKDMKGGPRIERCKRSNPNWIFNLGCS